MEPTTFDRIHLAFRGGKEAEALGAPKEEYAIVTYKNGDAIQTEQYRSEDSFRAAVDEHYGNTFVQMRGAKLSFDNDAAYRSADSILDSMMRSRSEEDIDKLKQAEKMAFGFMEQTIAEEGNFEKSFRGAAAKEGCKSFADIHYGKDVDVYRCGVEVEGYRSDMSRTLAKNASALQVVEAIHNKVYKGVRDVAKPGVLRSELEAKYRSLASEFGTPSKESAFQQVGAKVAELPCGWGDLKEGDVVRFTSTIYGRTNGDLYQESHLIVV